MRAAGSLVTLRRRSGAQGDACRAPAQRSLAQPQPLQPLTLHSRGRETSSTRGGGATGRRSDKRAHDLAPVPVVHPLGDRRRLEHHQPGTMAERTPWSGFLFPTGRPWGSSSTCPNFRRRTSRSRSSWKVPRLLRRRAGSVRVFARTDSESPATQRSIISRSGRRAGCRVLPVTSRPG